MREHLLYLYFFLPSFVMMDPIWDLKHWYKNVQTVDSLVNDSFVILTQGGPTPNKQTHLKLKKKLEKKTIF